MGQATLWSDQTVLSADAGSAARARAFVAHRLVEHRLPHLVDDVRLVTSELATNAVLHARTDFSVTLAGRERSVLLTVRDQSALLPEPLLDVADQLRGSGLGLLIVDQMSQSWGVRDQDGTAKSVWASFALHAPAGA